MHENPLVSTIILSTELYGEFEIRTNANEYFSALTYLSINGLLL